MTRSEKYDKIKYVCKRYNRKYVWKIRRQHVIITSNFNGTDSGFD